MVGVMNMEDGTFAQRGSSIWECASLVHYHGSVHDPHMGSEGGGGWNGMDRSVDALNPIDQRRREEVCMRPAG